MGIGVLFSMTKLKLLDLFSGIGGFSLGLEESGLCETAAFCEIDEDCAKVLNKNWPGTKVYNDVCSLTAQRLKDDGIGSIDIICGGFPCQDLSSAGKREGIEGKRSGLWREYWRIISELRPQIVIIENVSGLIVGDNGKWFSRLLSDLAEIGYDARWHCIRANYVGLPQNRDRVWIIAHNPKIRFNSFEEIFSKVAIEIRNRRTPKEMSALFGYDSKEQSYENVRDWRDDDGISKAAHRFGQLGNAVTPLIPLAIGKTIKQILTHQAA